MGWDEMRGSIEMEGMEIFLWWRGEDDIGPSTLPEVGVGKKNWKTQTFFFLLAGAHGKYFFRYNSLVRRRCNTTFGNPGSEQFAALP